MGRAIDMENKLDKLEVRVKKIEGYLDYLSSTVTTKKNIDIIEETKDEQKETNNETDGKSSKSTNTRKSVSKKKVSKSWVCPW